VAGQRFIALDGLRGFAAVAVVSYHLRTWTPAAFSAGYLAVDLFFVLSGFVIAAAYEPRLRSGEMGVTTFLRVRLIRLWPLYLLGVGLAMLTPLVSLVTKGGVLPVYAPSWAALPFEALMAPSPGHGSLYRLDPVAWSLAFELLINVTFVLTWRRWTLRNLIIVVGFLGILSLSANPGSRGWTWDQIPYGLLRVGFAFPTGVLVYRLHTIGLRPPKLPLSALVAALGAMMLTRSSGEACVLLGFPALIWLGASAEPSRLTRPLCVILGSASYGLYTIHEPLFEALAAWAARLGPSNHTLIAAAFMVAVVVTAIYVDRRYDVPARQFLSRRRRRSALRPASADA